MIKKYRLVQNKFVIIFFLILLFLPLINAECNSNNHFALGTEVNICTGNCYYQNETDTSLSVACDDSVNCKISALYPNGSILTAYEDMSRINNIFNKSFGYINKTGKFPYKFSCFRNKGWEEITGEFEIYDPDINAGSSKTDYVTSKQAKEIAEGVFDRMYSQLREQAPKIAFFSGLGLLILTAFIIRNKKRKDNAQKEYIDNKSKPKKEKKQIKYEGFEEI